MKVATLLPLTLAATVLAEPVAVPHSPFSVLVKNNNTDFDGPEAWMFTLTSWRGPGCPDYPTYNGSEPYLKTRSTTSTIYKTANDTYWWFFAFPWMKSELAKDDSSRMTRLNCEMDVKYEEVDPYGGKPKKLTHKLRLHKNGTVIEANYKLDNDVVAEWQTRYYIADDPTVSLQDWTNVGGPLEAGSDSSMRMDWLSALYTDGQLLFPECGIGSFRVRLDLWLAGRVAGVGGTVDSKKIDWNNGKGPQWSGTQMGISHDWEKC